MTINPFQKKGTIAALLFCAFVFFSAFYSWPSSIYPLEQVDKHYKTLAALSPAPNAARSNLDTVQFPWAEYSKNAMLNSLMRSYYLSEEQEEKLPFLITCPANSSDQTRGDLDYLLSLQQKRSPKEIERANYIANIGSWPGIENPTDPDFTENRKELFYIAGSMGEWFNSDNFPAITQLLLNCIQDTRATEFRLKRHFKRPRPYHLEPKLQPLMRINSPSFASGHSLWAFTQAFIFSEIIPEKREEFIQKAEEVRWSRELLGLHYPSDNEASRIISWNLLNDWYNNLQFAKDMEKARVEWATKKHLYL